MAGSGPATMNGHAQGAQRQILINLSCKCPADHLAAVQVDHHRQMQPALACPDAGHINTPDPVWLRYIKLSVEMVGGQRIALQSTAPDPVLALAKHRNTCQLHQLARPVTADWITLVL